MVTLVIRKTPWHKKNPQVYPAFIIALIIVASVVGAGYYQEYQKTKGVYVLDVGSPDEHSDVISQLGPANRVSEKKAEYVDGKLETYRELLSLLVYFSVTVPEFWKTMTVSVKFKDNFPENSDGLYLGVQKGPGWNYSWHKIYDPALKELSNYSYIEENGTYLYFINPDAPKYDSVSVFLDNLPTNYTIGHDGMLDKYQKPNENLKWEKGEFFLNNSLRGSHEFWIYAKGDLKVNFVKEDLNWYEGEDELILILEDFYGNEIDRMKIPDDGYANVTNNKKKQEVNWEKKDLDEGIYKLRLISEGTGADTTINDLKINQEKVVFNYLFPLKPAELYAEDATMNFETWHNPFQNITFDDKILSINNKSKKYYFEVKNKSNINIPKGDVVINSNRPISKKKENLFSLYNKKLIYGYKNSDYYLAKYNYEVHNENNIITSSFNIKDNYYLKDQTLSLILNAKHLSATNYKNKTIPVYQIGVEFED